MEKKKLSFLSEMEEENFLNSVGKSSFIFC